MNPVHSTLQEINSQLAQGMGPRLHWFPEDVALERLATIMVGMANSTGGSILIGIAPRSGQIQGIKDPEAAFDRVFQAILLIEPTLVLPMPQLKSVDKELLLHIDIPQGLPNVYSLEGRYLGREGSQTNPLPARRLRQLLFERGIVHFESQVPPQATLDDLDPEKVMVYLQAIDLPGISHRGLEENWVGALQQRGCLKIVDQELHPTYAALLLFGRRPQQWMPNATILAARFSGPAITDQFIKQDITGALPEQLRLAELFLRENLRSVVRMVGLAHQETSEYPLDALRELLVNAIAHRDYNLQGDNIHLRIFADRIEIQSPGGLPGPVTLDNLLEARFSRNAVIVQTLADLGFVERLGYGLDRVVNIMQQHGLRPPRFEEVAGCFRVTLYGEPGIAFNQVTTQSGQIKSIPQTRASLPDLSAYPTADLNPRQQAALAYIVQYARITNREFQELCPEVHSETLRRDLSDMVTQRILIKVGDKRATYYILK